MLAKIFWFSFSKVDFCTKSSFFATPQKCHFYRLSQVCKNGIFEGSEKELLVQKSTLEKENQKIFASTYFFCQKPFLQVFLLPYCLLHFLFYCCSSSSYSYYSSCVSSYYSSYFPLLLLLLLLIIFSLLLVFSSLWNYHLFSNLHQSLWNTCCVFLHMSSFAFFLLGFCFFLSTSLPETPFFSNPICFQLCGWFLLMVLFLLAVLSKTSILSKVQGCNKTCFFKTPVFFQKVRKVSVLLVADFGPNP